MSSRYSSSSHRDRRRSPSPRRRRESPRRDSRRSSPPRSPPRRERDASDLPSSFDREPRESKDDQRDVLERMEKHCDSGPMKVLLRCVNDKVKVKVWTRNYKEVRGICSGYVTFFDKHWNLVMKDVEEIFLRPKKGKTPFLEDYGSNGNIPEAQPKVPKEKKSAEVLAQEKAAAEEKAAATAAAAEGKTKKKRRKKKKNKMEKRHVQHLFLRGDNIVMISVCEDEEDDDVVEVENEQAQEDSEPEIMEIKEETAA